VDLADLFVAVHANVDPAAAEVVAGMTAAGAEAGAVAGEGIATGLEAKTAEAVGRIHEIIFGSAEATGAEAGDAMGAGIEAGVVENAIAAAEAAQAALVEAMSSAGITAGEIAGTELGSGIYERFQPALEAAANELAAAIQAAAAEGGAAITEELNVAIAEAVSTAAAEMQALAGEIAAAGVEGGAAAGEGIAAGIGKGASEAKEQIIGIKEALEALAFAEFMKTAIEDATQFEETMARVEFVFGEAADAATSFASNAAESLGASKTAALQAEAQFGLLGKTAGLSGAGLEDFSQKLTTVVSNLSAFSGQSFEQVATTIMKATEGMTRGLKAYGIVITQSEVEQEAISLGLIKQGDALTDTARILASYQLILQATDQFQGYFASHVEEAGEKEKIASAKFNDAATALGTAFLPIFSKVLDVVTSAVNVFSGLPQPIQLAIVGITGLVALLPVLAIGFNAVATSVETLGLALDTALPELGLIALGVGAAVTAVSFAFGLFGDSEDKAAAKTKDLSAALKDVHGNIDDYVQKTIQATLDTDKLSDPLRKAGISTKEMSAALLGEAGARDTVIGKVHAYAEATKTANGYTDDAKKLISGVTKEFDDYRTASQGVFKSVLDQVSASGALTDQQRELFGALADAKTAQDQVNAAQALGVVTTDPLTGATVNYSAAIQQLIDAQDAQEKKTEEVAQSMKDADAATQAQIDAQDELVRASDQGTQLLTVFQQSLDASATAADNLSNALHRLIGDQADLQKLSDAQVAAEQAVDAARKKNGATLDENTEKGRNNRQAIRDSIDAELAYDAALIKQGDSSDDVALKLEQFRGRLVDQAMQFGLTKDQAEDYVNQLGLTPESIKTSIELANVQKAHDDVQNHLNDLDKIPAEKKTEIQALIDQGKFNEAQAEIDRLTRPRTLAVSVQFQTGASSIFGNVKAPDNTEHSAAGGPVPAGVPRIVGELGPELFVPDSSGTIIPNNQLKSSGRFGTQVDASLTIYGNVYGVDDLDQYMEQRDRKLAFALGAGRR
jgi:hypothetical protein